MKNLNKLREQRKEAAAHVRKLVDDSADQEWTPANQADYDKYVEVIDGLDAQITRIQKVVDLEGARQESISEEADASNLSEDEVKATRDWKNKLFNAWAAGGMGNLTPEQLDFVRAENAKAKAAGIQNAQSVGTGAEGGFTAHSEFGGELFKAMKAFGGVRSVANVITTSTGNAIEWPTTNTTAQEGELVGENAAVGSVVDVVFGQVSIGAYKFSSLPIAIPMELMQDSLINIEQHIMEILVERIARVSNRLYTVGTGSSQPTGIVTASALGKTATAAAAITFDELIDLEHSVDPAYRASGQCSFMFHDSTLKTLKKLKDGDSRPIWLPGYATGEGNQILGYDYTINQNMDELAAAKKVALFGKMNSYMVRDVGAVQLFRMTDSKYTEKGQVGFLVFVRTDGQFIGADNGCISHLITAAS